MQIREFKTGMWYCSVSIMGDDGDPITRYLNKDGGWNGTSSYWETKQAVCDRLAAGIAVPDFPLCDMEREDRACIRNMYDLDNDSDWDSDDDEPW